MLITHWHRKQRYHTALPSQPTLIAFSDLKVPRRRKTANKLAFSLALR
jgi:hypothetical protein